ncbi:MAG: alpha/beta hydrolase, partial [Janthinobacterium sp.]
MKRTLQTCILLAGVLLAGAGQAAAPTAFTAEVTGQGRPLILIPGLASSGEVWQGTVARLCGPQATRQCHVLTLAGFAGVPAIAGDLLAQAEQQLADYIVAKKLAQPAIIGHSLGGFVALKMAIDHPRQTGKLVIVDSLPALGAAQLPSSTPEQLQAMATQMHAAMRAQDAAGASASQRRTVSGMASAPADVERIIGWGQR